MSSTVATQVPDLQNYVGGHWLRSSATEYVDVANPATSEILARTPFALLGGTYKGETGGWSG